MVKILLAAEAVSNEKLLPREKNFLKRWKVRLLFQLKRSMVKTLMFVL